MSDRIAEQRDRAREQSEVYVEGDPRNTPRNTPRHAPGNEAPPRRDAGDPAEGEVVGNDPSELASIPEAVNPEDQLPLGPSSAASGGDGASSRPSGGWVMNTLAALGVVIGLVFLVRWVAKRGGLGGGVRVAGSSPIVEVLSRTTVAPRNHVVLLRVGARILVVNDGTSGMRTLATVDNPDEVAGLLQSVEVSRETSMSNSFGKAMAKLSGPWSAADEAADLGNDDSEHGIDRTRSALTGLRTKLRLAAAPGQGGDA